MKQLTEINEILKNTQSANNSISDAEIEEIGELLSDIEQDSENDASIIENLKREVAEKNSEIIAMQETIDEREEIDLNCVLPDGSLECQQKNKILQNLHENCSLGQLENLELQAKKSVEHNGIIYKEVL